MDKRCLLFAFIVFGISSHVCAMHVRQIEASEILLQYKGDDTKIGSCNPIKQPHKDASCGDQLRDLFSGVSRCCDRLRKYGIKQHLKKEATDLCYHPIQKRKKDMSCRDQLKGLTVLAKGCLDTLHEEQMKQHLKKGTVLCFITTCVSLLKLFHNSIKSKPE